MTSQCAAHPTLEQKRQALFARLDKIGRLMVAFSGGADSAYLAWAAHRALGAEMLAVLADSASLSRAHLRDAVLFATTHGIPLRIVTTSELENPNYARNDSTRCFHCKDELFKVISQLGAPLGFSHIAYGMNEDDRADFRPGREAAAQNNVLAPLAEVGLTKEEVRLLAREAGLRIWDKPASACLSSRIAYGLPVTRATLNAIEQAEAVLHALGFLQCRVRHHGELARIEISRDELDRILSLSVFEQVVAALKSIGYKYVTLDMEGYRTGSMNDLLSVSVLTA